MSITGRKRGPYRTGIETRRKAVEAAISIFTRHGYYAGTLQAIAAEVGVSAAALTQLFGSKKALLFAVIEETDRRAGELLAEAEPGMGFLRGLSSIVEIDGLQRGMIGLHVTLAAEAADPAHPLHEFMVERYQRIRRSIGEQILTAARNGDLVEMDVEAADVEAALLISGMDGLQLQWLLSPSDDLEARFQHVLDVTLTRLAPVRG